MEELSGSQTTSINLSELQTGAEGGEAEDMRSAVRLQGLFGRTNLSSAMSTYDLSQRKDRSPGSIPKIGNFQDSYIRGSLWPELDYADQCALRKEYSDLQGKYTAKVKENSTLRVQIAQGVTGTPGCENCSVEKEKRIATQKALGQAVELSPMLLQEVRRLDNELTRATSPKRPS